MARSDLPYRQPRLFPDQIARIVNHAQDAWLRPTPLCDLEKIADQLPSVERYIVSPTKANMPQTT